MRWRGLGNKKTAQKRGTTTLEFLLVFPMFLFFCLFVMEAAQMAADKHIQYLANFAAARAIAQHISWTETIGEQNQKVCENTTVMKKAREAAIFKLATISEPVDSLIGKVKADLLPNDIKENVHKVKSEIPGPLARILLRWPDAALSTKLRCEYNPATRDLDLTLTYHRLIKTPVMDRILYYLYTLTTINRVFHNAGFEYGLKDDWYHVGVEYQTPQALQTLQGLNKQNVLNQLKIFHLDGQSALDGLNMLNSIPALGPYLSGAVPIPHAISQTAHTVDQALAESIPAQNQVLQTILSLVPPAFFRLPVKTKVHMHLDLTPSEVDFVGNVPKEKPFEGRLKSIMHLHGAYRTWAKNLSRP